MNVGIYGSPLAPGSRLLSYELLEAVSRGVTSTVWLARIVRGSIPPSGRVHAFERLVAIKTYAPELAADPSFRETLLAQACLASAVFHPNVVQVLDVNEEEPLAIVSEWVDGDSLADLRWAVEKTGKKIPAGIVLRLLADTCAGLHAAHQLRDRTNKALGLSHGEVSPTSILISTAGVARLIDMGLATAKAATKRGTQPAFDRHTDIAAMGALLALHLAPESWPVDVPEEVDELISRARATDRTERFATAAEMQGAIERAMIALGMVTTTASVAAYVAQHLFDRTAARAAMIETALSAQQRVPSSTIPAAVNTVRPAGALAPLPALPSFSPHGWGGSSGGPRFLRRVPLAVTALGLAVGIAIASFVTRSSDSPHPMTNASGSSPPLVAAPPKAKPACPEGMLRIPGGKFYMGSDDEAQLEKPSHQVTISPYCIEEFEVTASQYKACSDTGDCKRASTVNQWDGINEGAHKAFDSLCNEREPVARGMHPANCIDWEMARVYCGRAGGRLPTEAEWEFAARGPDGRRYPWGDEEPSELLLNACGKECLAWGKQNGVELEAMYTGDDGWPSTAPVGSFPAGKSRYGVQDVVGNVWEWVNDWYSDYGDGAQVEPKGPPSGETRVIRGGAWNGTQATWVRPTFRYKNAPTTRSHGIGFRCARSL